MSESTIAAVAAPFVAQAEKALEPAAAQVVSDLRSRISAEADALRTALPGLGEAAAAHVHAIVGEVLGRYQGLMNDIDHVLTGAPVAPQGVIKFTDPAPAAAPAGVIKFSEPVDPTSAPPATTDSSAPVSVPSSTDSGTTPADAAAPTA